VAYKISRETVWAGDLLNRPGMVARVLEAVRNAGGNLEFVVARKVSANTARLFVAPVKGAKLVRAAREVGLSPADSMHTVRILGPDRPGLGADLTRAIADAGINIRGLSSAAMAKQSVCLLAFATDAEAKSAIKVVKKSLAKRK